MGTNYIIRVYKGNGEKIDSPALSKDEMEKYSAMHKKAGDVIDIKEYDENGKNV